VGANDQGAGVTPDSMGRRDDSRLLRIDWPRMGDGTSNGAERRRRVALVHDFLLDLRGAERVFLAMCETWPDADVFTAVYDPKGTEGRFEHRNVHSTFLQRL